MGKTPYSCTWFSVIDLSKFHKWIFSDDQLRNGGSPDYATWKVCIHSYIYHYSNKQNQAFHFQLSNWIEIQSVANMLALKKIILVCVLIMAIEAQKGKLQCTQVGGSGLRGKKVQQILTSKFFFVFHFVQLYIFT